MSRSSIHNAESTSIMRLLKDESVQLVWTDPPFNTGKEQTLKSTNAGYIDQHVNYLEMLFLCFVEAHRVLDEQGVCCVCLDYREVHSAKWLLDKIFGQRNYRGEIIWHFELGGIAKSWWTNKHNTILLYSKGKSPRFYFDSIPTKERKAPKKGYEGDKKIASVWNFTMSNMDPERAGYPNQKPVEIIEPFVLAHTDPGGFVLDPFAGSGSTGAAAVKHNRNFILIDSNPQAAQIMSERLQCPLSS